MIASHFFRENRMLIYGYFLLMHVTGALSVFFWPELREQIDLIVQLIPLDGVRRFAEAFQTQGYWAYFDAQILFKGGGMVATAVAGLLGSGLIAREADRNTAEFLLSRPISRAQILFRRWLAGCAMLLIPFFSCVIFCWALSPQVGESLQLGRLLASTAHVSLFILAVFQATIWLSAHSTQQLRAGIIVLGFIMLNMAIYLVKHIWHYSIFNIIDLDVLLPLADRGAYPWKETTTLAAASLVFYFFSWRAFSRRDF
ncbi:MAG: ABC transporter permease subunit [Planctomycetes bacterium]|jgi:ABC-type transport system involved in multi-copper enzyme maturation permease subunit|nr:ABC transporter permease subunit [Planctomycetota bacterium]MBT4028697.1 ABC transporter permease subunit [Planctomycetota bacterium]MBT4560089.1 ABC transporter permease subunit [Planctomycetota bacterium]MBT5102263.1 ABC transporter permease subunit [Planctomycetota bacterium]MBT5120356.1 ABC transporter permease subunit [Planctomycetota bacterium]